MFEKLLKSKKVLNDCRVCIGLFSQVSAPEREKPDDALTQLAANFILNVVPYLRTSPDGVSFISKGKVEFVRRPLKERGKKN